MAYVQERAAELDALERHVRNERHLLLRTQENIALWNCGCAGAFPRKIVLVGFRYAPTAEPFTRSVQRMRYVYDGVGRPNKLDSYVCTHAREGVTLRAIKRGVPTRLILTEPLETEVEALDLQLARLETLRSELYTLAPGGEAYNCAKRRAADLGFSRYKLRRTRSMK